MKMCPSCQKQIEDDSFFCEFCGNQLESYSAFASVSRTQNKPSKGKKAAIIVLSILLTLVLCGAGLLGYMLYATNIYYSEQITVLDEEKTNLQKQYNSAISERDNYKKKYDDAQKGYNEAIVNASKLRSQITTFEKIQEELKKVTPTNNYGGFGSKIYAVKKGEKITVNIPYSYTGQVTGWYDTGYEMDWLSSTYGYLKFYVKGKTPGVYTFRINHSGTSETGGITTIIYVYE